MQNVMINNKKWKTIYQSDNAQRKFSTVIGKEFFKVIFFNYAEKRQYTHCEALFLDDDILYAFAITV